VFMSIWPRLTVWPEGICELEWNLFVTAQFLIVSNVLAGHGKVAYDSGKL